MSEFRRPVLINDYGELAYSLHNTIQPPTEVKMWELPDWTEKSSYIHDEEASLTDMAIDVLDRGLWLSESTGKIFLFNMEDQEATITLDGHESTVTSLAISPKGKLLLSGGDDGVVHLWSVKREASKLEIKPSSIPLRVKFSGDGKLLLTLGEEGHIEIWNKLGEKQAEFAHEQVVDAVFGPNNERLYTVDSDYENGSCQIKVWDIEEERELEPIDVICRPEKFERETELLPERSHPLSVAIHPLESMLAAGTEVGFVFFYDLEKEKPLGAQWPQPKIDVEQELPGIPDYLYFCGFHPEGTSVVAQGLEDIILTVDVPDKVEALEEQLAGEWEKYVEEMDEMVKKHEAQAPPQGCLSILLWFLPFGLAWLL